MKNLELKLIMILLMFNGICFAQSNKLMVEPHLFKSNAGQKIEAELGKFSVPENRSIPGSRNIDLYFVRFKSTNPNPGNPIIYLAGGPGGSGIATAKGPRFELFMALREIADVIAFDQRGTGYSNQIPACDTKAQIELDVPGSEELYVSKMANATKECISFWKQQGVEVEGYNTMESANDLEDLKKVLGVSKINLWGISYGTHLAFEFIKRYENSIDKVVLAGLEGPDQSIKLPENNQNFLKELQGKIDLDEKTAAAYPDLLGLMQEVFTKLENNPLHIEVKDPRTGHTFKLGISKFDVQLVTSFMLTKNPENSKRLPYLFQQMKQGNYTEIGQMVGGLKFYAGRVNGMSLLMDAMSGISQERWAKVQKQSENSLLGRTTNFPFPSLAFELDLPDLGESFRENPESSVPALLLSGTLDGRTYMESAKELATGFSNHSHVIIDGAGHDLFMSTPKVEELILAFLKGEEVLSQTIRIDVPAFALPEN